MQQTLITNRLIESLSVQQRSRILKIATVVDLDFNTILCEEQQDNQFVYFPITGFISSIAVLANHPPLELGLIGNEGMFGSCITLGVSKAPLKQMVQGAGTALRIPVDLFQQELLANPDLLKLLHRYVYFLMRQLAQAAVCIHYHEIEARLARWLLMTNDRAHSNTFLMTHVFLAQILGVRRSGVSIAASALRKKQLIEYARGKIKILDRKGLENSSCSCYLTLKSCYGESIH